MRRARRVAMVATALLLGVFAVGAWARAPSSADPEAKVAEGRQIFETGCTSCHGYKGRGVQGQGPSLLEAGAAAADFYVRTGRMPLGQVGEEPLRGEPRYSNKEIEALDAYVGSLGNGPEIPDVDPGKGSVSEGFELFSDHCAGCHAVTAKGGVAIGAYAPPLGESTPTEVGEAIRVGPYVMPRFSEAEISPKEVDSIARYVQLTQEPEDAGGWGIGHIGPVPEGLIAWFAAIGALLLVVRLIGDRLGGSRGDDEAEEPR